MKRNPLATLSPLCIGLIAGNAWAALEPFSLGASESVQHQSNVDHTDGVQAPIVAAWISITELNAGLDQAIGRDKLLASAAVDYTYYKNSHQLNGVGYQASSEFDWSTIGDLSGAFGADSHRRQFIYGETAEPTGTGSTSLVDVNVRNMQTDNHVFAKLALGGESRWTIFGGVDANQRDYSLDAFKSDEEKQWSTNAGTRYSTSPDLSFGLTASYVHGEYPHGLSTGAADFNSRSLNATTKWQASGNSSLDASLGYTTENSELLTGDRKFVDGSLNWAWTPPSHFSLNLGLKRSSDADASSTGVSVGVVNANDLNGTSINNVAHLEVVYTLTAKVNLDVSADYTQRKYSDLILLDATQANASTKTTRLYLTMHYQPTRTTDLSCGGGREIRHADAAIEGLLPSYNDNYLQCVASIHFD